MGTAVQIRGEARESGARGAPFSPLGLLARVNLLQAWRRIKAVRQQSRLLSALIGLFIVGYVVLAFWLFCTGLKFVANFPGLGTLLIERLMFLLFAFLFVLLLFSNLVISYTNLFQNRETTFLLSLPIPPQIIFRWKFMESALLASWAFLFLISPLLAAYGLTNHVPWHFYLATVALVALFIVLPAVAGAWLAVNVARYLDRRAFQLAAVGLAVLMLVGAGFWLKAEPITDDMLETRVLSVLDRLAASPDAKLIDVTAITPTKAGEGKTTTSVSLTQGLGHIGKDPVLCLREASLGPVFGIKGGAAGGGYAQVVPMEDMNLHFTGDIHAIGAANNLLAAMLEAHILHGNKLGIDPLSVSWRRCVDINDRALRDIALGLGGRVNGYVRQTGFDITAASEVMAIVAVASDLFDLRHAQKVLTAFGQAFGALPEKLGDLTREHQDFLGQAITGLAPAS